MREQRPTILCIADDLNSLEPLKTRLEQNGHHVVITASPRQGLELLASNLVEGVIFDDQTPEVQGDVASVRGRKAA